LLPDEFFMRPSPFPAFQNELSHIDINTGNPTAHGFLVEFTDEVIFVSSLPISLRADYLDGKIGLARFEALGRDRAPADRLHKKRGLSVPCNNRRPSPKRYCNLDVPRDPRKLPEFLAIR
jgi:hypothetical protein